jgi:serine phosphatase RsbU (regulator of sigma subunit)/pSer/pThr/pTyr-binding forkhead associated (FHA) protein
MYSLREGGVEQEGTDWRGIPHGMNVGRSGMPSLKVIAGEQPRRVFPLVKPTTLIGTHPTSDIVLVDPRASRTHARIEQSADGVSIEDLGSKHGTRVNGVRLSVPRSLTDGDLIEIGRYQLGFSAANSPQGITPSIVREIDASVSSGPQDAGVDPRERLRAVLEISSELMGVFDLDAVLEKILALLFRIFPHAERGFFLFREAGGTGIYTRASKVRDPASDRRTVSRSIYEYVVGAGRAILCEDLTADPRFSDADSVKASQARTLMCVPLWDHEHLPVGVLQIDTRNAHAPFGNEDLAFLVSVAGSVSMAVENARLHDIEVRHKQMEQEFRDARAVQLALMPARSPSVPGYQFWHDYEPARFVGGDYFDYRPIRDPGAAARDHEPTRWAIAVGDVAGKGMPAALLVARLSTEVRFLLSMESDPARVVEQLNRNLCSGGNADKFITFLLLVLDGPRNELSVVSAGHMAPLIRRGTGQIELIGEDLTGLPLGIVDGSAYGITTTSIDPGDVVVLYTDGVDSAMCSEREPFGFDRLKQSIAEAPASALSVGPAIREAIRRHVGAVDPFDDLTLLCFGRT